MRLLMIFILSPFFLLSQTQIGNDIDGIAAGDHSGYVSFSNDGTIVAIGGPGNDTNGIDSGHIRVFENVSGSWIQVGSDIYGEAAGDNFGESLSISGDGTIIAVGASSNDETGIDAGQVWVFENISGVWTKIGSAINGDTAGDNFGRDVSLSDNGTVLSITGRNYTRIYENVSGSWSQIGSDIYIGGSASGGSGGERTILSGDGSVVAISEWFIDFWLGPYTASLVYKNISGTWTQIGATNWSFSTAFSLSYDGSIMATTLFGEEGVLVYENLGNVWIQIGNTIVVEDYYSKSLSLSSNGDIIAIEGDAAIGDEVVSIYRNFNDNWIQIGNTINSVNADDNFGVSLELSGDGNTLVVGATNYDGNGIDSGYARVYDLTAVLSTNNYVVSQFKMYPNPAKNQFTIELNDNIELVAINIYNSLGQFVENTTNHLVNTSIFSSGLYYVEVITNNGKSTKKLMIE